MKALHLNGVGDLRLCDEPMPTPAQDETLIRVTAGGLCGSDLRWYDEGAISDARLSKPLVLGHEFAGVTTDGAHVAVDPAIPWANANNVAKAIRISAPRGDLPDTARKTARCASSCHG